MPVTDRRQLVVNKIKTALALILVSGGYYSNLGQKVTEGKVNPFGANRVNGVDVIDPSDATTDDAEDASIENHVLTIEVRTIAKDPVSPEVARQHIADVRKALLTLTSDTWWNQNTTNLTHMGNVMEIEQAEAKIIGTLITFTVEFNTLALQEA